MDTDGRRETFGPAFAPLAPAPPFSVRHPHHQRIGQGKRDPIGRVDELHASLHGVLGGLMPYAGVASLYA
jgi:hypothetical protein